MTAASRAGQLHIHRPGDASTTQTDTNEGVLCSPRSRGNASSTLLRCGTLVNNVSDCMHHTKAMHQAEGPSPHEPNHTMHRTPHSIRHDDKHQGPHWSRWALTALAAAAITACGGGSSEPPPPVNQVPTVAMAAPANNFKANAPAAVLLTATASDSDGTIAKVEFYKVNPAAPVFDATTLVGQANAVGTPPTYQLTTAPLAAGTYNFVARATDNSGATTNSVAVQVVMNASPAVAITAPTAGASIVPGTNFTLRATATDADGSVSKVEFFLNGSATALAGTVTKNGNEYSLPWTAVTGMSP